MMDFENLKAGDEIGIMRAIESHPAKIQKVDRTTKTQIILDNGERFLKTSGIACKPSGFYDRDKLVGRDVAEQHNEGLEREAHLFKRRLYLHEKASWNEIRKMTIDEVERLVNALPERLK